MQDVVGIGDRSTASIKAPDIALEHAKSLPESWANLSVNIDEVMLVAGCEIVEANHDLAEVEQRLDQIGTDKACSSSYQPALWTLLELGLQFFEGRGRQGAQLLHASLSDQPISDILEVLSDFEPISQGQGLCVFDENLR